MAAFIPALGRAGLWAGRRYAVPAIRSGVRIATNALRGSRGIVPIAGRIGTNIAMRPMGASAVRSVSARSMGTQAFRRAGQQAVGTGVRYTRGAALAGAGLGAAAGGAAAFDKMNGSKKRKKENQGFKNKDGEQVVKGDKGDGLTTNDKFVITTGDKSFKNAALCSGKQIVKRSRETGIKGVIGRASWGELTNIQKASDIIDLDTKFQLQWRAATGTTAAPGWIRGDNLQNTTGFTNRKFVYEQFKGVNKFKNQSSSPAHLEYFIITPKDTLDQITYWQDDFVGGFTDKIGANANRATVSGVTYDKLVETPIDYKLNMSTEFKRNWTILYSHKVRLVEGQYHEFNWTDNANRLINLAALPQSTGTIKNMTKHLIYKVYGSLGDSSNLLGTIGTLSTTPSKILVYMIHTEMCRQVLTTPKLFLDETTALSKVVANLYEKDPNTGAVEDGMIE